MVMGGYGVDTGGFGWLLVIVNNPKIIGPKMSKIIKRSNRSRWSRKIIATMAMLSFSKNNRYRIAVEK